VPRFGILRCVFRAVRHWPWLLAALLLAGCITVEPPNDTGNLPSSSGMPTAPGDPDALPSADQSIGYDPDMKALFASDCLLCHGGVRTEGNFRVTSYADVMHAVTPGSLASALVTVTASTGSMYRHFSGNGWTKHDKSDQVRAWVVTYNARETR
jgi:hypothetical protein